jgi:hypothetical protein
VSVDNTSGAPSPAEDDEEAGLKEPVIDLVSDLADTWTATSLAKSYVELLIDVDNADATAPPPPPPGRFKRGRKALSGGVSDMAGTYGGFGAGIIAKVFFFLVELWILAVRRRPAITLALSFAVIAAVVLINQVRDQQAETAARIVEAQQQATREVADAEAQATREVVDAEARAIVTRLDVEAALSDPALFGRGSKASALRCEITMSNHDQKKHVAILDLRFAYTTVPDAQHTPDRPQTGALDLQFTLGPGATNVASDTGSPTLFELDVPAGRLERFDITDSFLAVDGRELPSVELRPVPTGCNYAPGGEEIPAGRLRRCPMGCPIGGMASSNVSKTTESWRLAPVRRLANGSPPRAVMPVKQARSGTYRY